MKVGFIGLGNIGAPQAELIGRAGMDLVLYDAYAPALEKFAGKAQIAASPAEVARNAEIICICVRDDKQLHEVVMGAGGLIEGLTSGSLLLVHSTVRIQTLKELQAELAKVGASLVDAAVSRTSPKEDVPFAFTMLGGTDEDVARAKPVVEPFSSAIDHVGPLGSGMATKISNNLVAWSSHVIGGIAAELAIANGAPYEKLRAVMESNGNLNTSMAASLDGRYLSPRAEGGPNPEAKAFMEKMSNLGEKDIQLVIESAQDLGLDVAVPLAVQKMLGSIMIYGTAKKA